VNEEKPEDPKDHIAEKINKIKEDVDEDDFIIFDSHTEDVEETVTESENQIEFTFDLPIKESATSGSANIKHTNDVREMEIIDMEVVRSEEPKKEKIKYTLEIEEEYSPEIRVLNEMKEDEDMKIELKIDQNRVVEEPKQTIVREEETTENENITEEDVSPLNLTISELRKRADERRRKMKDFNYKFINRLNQNIDDIESQPAYKRMGVDIDGGVPSSDNSMNKSRTTLNLDENDEIQFRSNNSFLHDNVD